MGLLDAPLIHEIPQIFGKLFQCKRSAAPGGFSVAAGIQSQHPEVVGKGFGLAAEITAVLAVAVQQNQGRAFPLFHRMNRNIHKSSPAISEKRLTQP